MTPTDKAIAMAQRIEELEQWNLELMRERETLKQAHKQEIDLYKAYQNGIETTLTALLGKTVKL